ncbi:hypothetical protein OEZ86_004958 [Tetradesmus obliquus]|nr:hypothetical protein OEZ86_004958 [Tetradesmus obliquus]
MRVGGDIAGAGVEFVVDSGCGHSVVSLAQAQDLVSVLGKLGSSVPVGLGLGVYPQHFLVMEGANFPITLGLDFCNTYGAKIFSRSWHNRQYNKPWAYRKGHKD